MSLEKIAESHEKFQKGSSEGELFEDHSKAEYSPLYLCSVFGLELEEIPLRQSSHLQPMLASAKSGGERGIT